MTRPELMALIDEVTQRIEAMKQEAGRVATRTGDIEQAEAYLEKLYNTITEDERVVTLKKKLTAEDKQLKKAISECEVQTEKYRTESVRLGEILQNTRGEHEAKVEEINTCQIKLENLKSQIQKLEQDEEGKLQSIKILEERMEQDKKVLEELVQARLELTEARQEAENSRNEALQAKQETQRLEGEIEAMRQEMLKDVEGAAGKIKMREKILNQGVVNLEKKEKILEIKRQKLIQYKNECEVYYNRLFKDLII